jgi:hypothetical protein
MLHKKALLKNNLKRTCIFIKCIPQQQTAVVYVTWVEETLSHNKNETYRNTTGRMTHENSNCKTLPQLRPTWTWLWPWQVSKNWGCRLVIGSGRRHKDRVTTDIAETCWQMWEITYSQSHRWYYGCQIDGTFSLPTHDQPHFNRMIMGAWKVSRGGEGRGRGGKAWGRHDIGLSPPSCVSFSA